MKNNQNAQTQDVSNAQGVRHAQDSQDKYAQDAQKRDGQGVQNRGGQGSQDKHGQGSQDKHGQGSQAQTDQNVQAQVSSIKNELATPANIVTLARILLIPVFVAVILSPWPEWFPDPGFWTLVQPWLAAVVFSIISATDALDGYLARSRGQVTDVGKFMDPLADKILVCAALLALVELQQFPSWVALVIIAREFIVSGLRMVAAAKGEVIAASWFGKAKTVLQIATILLFIVKYALGAHIYDGAFGSAITIVAWVVLALAVIMTLLSMVDYFVKARFLFEKNNDEHLVNDDGESFINNGEHPSKEDVGHVLAGNESDEHYGTNEKLLTIDKRNEEIAAQIIEHANKLGISIGCAESCTGGLIAQTITRVAGSSSVFVGGVVSYACSVKESILDVNSQIFHNEGVISEKCASEMAKGAAKALNCDLAVSTTGIAGPSGAEPGKPVGTVCFGLYFGKKPKEKPEKVCQNLTTCKGSSRQEIRLLATQTALMLILDFLETL